MLYGNIQTIPRMVYSLRGTYISAWASRCQFLCNGHAKASTSGTATVQVPLFLCPYSDHMDMSINSPQIIQLPRVNDIRGNLSFFESENQLPFDIKRVHWIYDVPGGETRGEVAYKTAEEFIVAMSGSFDVKVQSLYNIGRLIFICIITIQLVPLIMLRLRNWSGECV